MSDCDFGKAEISDSPTAANLSLNESTDDQEAEECCQKADKEFESAAQASTTDATAEFAECAGNGDGHEGATNTNSDDVVDAVAIADVSLKESADTHPTPEVEPCGQEADKVSESATQASTQDVSESSLEAVAASESSLEEPPKGFESATQVSTPEASGASAEFEECSGSVAEQEETPNASSEASVDDTPVSRARRKDMEWQRRVQAQQAQAKEEVIEKRAAKFEFEQARIKKDKEDLVSLDRELGAIEARMLRSCAEQEEVSSPAGPEDEVFDARTNSRRRLHEQLLRIK